MDKLFKLFLLVIFIPPWLFSCAEGQVLSNPVKQPEGSAMLEPGDTFADMLITTGADNVPPLWAFCTNSPEGNGSYILDCRVPALTTLGIGNIFPYAGEAITDVDWSDLVWELSIDAQEVNLESFGTFDYVMPGANQDPSQVRAAIKQGTAWNIMLTDLKPGHHTLWFVARSKAGSYSWCVNLDIEPETFNELAQTSTAALPTI